MKRTFDYRTATFLAALACMIVGFVPIVSLTILAALEYAWLFVHELQGLEPTLHGVARYAAATASDVFQDWASLYGPDGDRQAGLFMAQCGGALLWCLYLVRARSTSSACT